MYYIKGSGRWEDEIQKNIRKKLKRGKPCIYDVDKFLEKTSANRSNVDKTLFLRFRKPKTTIKKYTYQCCQREQKIAIFDMLCYNLYSYTLVRNNK